MSLERDIRMVVQRMAIDFQGHGFHSEPRMSPTDNDLSYRCRLCEETMTIPGRVLRQHTGGALVSTVSAWGKCRGRPLSSGDRFECRLPPDVLIVNRAARTAARWARR